MSAPRDQESTRFYPAYAGVPFDQKRVKTRLPNGTTGATSGPLATALGLFSIGLGLWEAAAPRSVAQRTGVRYPGVLRAYGLRELTTGLGILSSDRPAFWLWNRVGGDVIDLATIAAAYTQAPSADRRKALAAAVAVLGVAVLDLLCACEHSRDSN